MLAEPFSWQLQATAQETLGTDIPIGEVKFFNEVYYVDYTLRSYVSYPRNYRDVHSGGEPPYHPVSHTFFRDAPNFPCTVRLEVVRARGPVLIEQQPNAGNNWTTIVVVHDEPPYGRYTYEWNLYFTATVTAEVSTLTGRDQGFATARSLSFANVDSYRIRWDNYKGGQISNIQITNYSDDSAEVESYATPMSGSETGNIYAKVLNSPPSVTSLSIDGQGSGARLLNRTPLLSWVYSDPDDDPQQSFQVSGAWSASGGSGDSSRSSAVLAKGQSYSVSVRVYDGNYWSGWSSISFRINGIPSVSNLQVESRINPFDVVTLTPTFSWSFSDPDGDAQSKYQIYVGTAPGLSNMWNSGEIPSNTTNVMYAGMSLARNTTYYWRVRAYDGYEWSNWQSGYFKIKEIINEPPVVSNLKCEGQINPTAIDTFTPTLSWAYSDPDGDAQTQYQIYVGKNLSSYDMWNSGILDGINTSIIYDGGLLERNVVYYWQVRVKDTYDWSDWAIGTFKLKKVVNNIPQALELLVSGRIEPSDLIDLTPSLSWTYFDLDNDPQAKFQVYVGTSVNSKDMWDSGEKPGSDTRISYQGYPLSTGVSYYWQVRVHDGTEWSVWAKSTFRLAPLIPTVEEVEQEPKERKYGRKTAETVEVIQSERATSANSVIDEFRILNRAISKEEIEDDYNLGLAGEPFKKELVLLEDTAVQSVLSVPKVFKVPVKIKVTVSGSVYNKGNVKIFGVESSTDKYPEWESILGFVEDENSVHSEDSWVITVFKKPLEKVSRVYNKTTSETYTVDQFEKETGIVNLSGIVAPKRTDILEVDYYYGGETLIFNPEDYPVAEKVLSKTSSKYYKEISEIKVTGFTNETVLPTIKIESVGETLFLAHFDNLVYNAALWDTDWAKVRDRKAKDFEFEVVVLNPYNCLINKDLIERLVNIIKPAHTRAFISFKETDGDGSIMFKLNGKTIYNPLDIITAKRIREIVDGFTYKQFQWDNKETPWGVGVW